MNVREDLKAFVDGELTPERTEEVRRAVEADPELQAEVDLMRAIGTEIRSMSRDPEIVGMERVLSAVRERTGPRLLWGMRPVFVYCLGIALVGLSAYTLLPTFAQAKSSSRTMVAYGKARGDAGAAPGDAAADAAKMPQAFTNSAEAPLVSEGAESKEVTKAAPFGAKSGATEAPAAGTKRDRRTDGLTTTESESTDVKADGIKSPAYRMAEAVPQHYINGVDVVIQVPDVDAAVRRAQRVASSKGGFMQWEDPPEQSAERKKLVLCVPGPSFESMLNDLVASGKVIAQDRRRTDAKAEHSNLTLRLRALGKQLVAWKDRLTRRPKENPTAVQRQVVTLNNQISNLKLRQDRLARDPSLSSIVATVEQKPRTDYGIYRHQAAGVPAEPAGARRDPWFWALGVSLFAVAGYVVWRLLRRA